LQLDCLASSLENLPEREKGTALKLLESTLLLRRDNPLPGDSDQDLQQNPSPKNLSGPRYFANQNDVLNGISKHRRSCDLLLSQQKEILSRPSQSSSFKEGCVSQQEVQVTNLLLLIIC